MKRLFLFLGISCFLLACSDDNGIPAPTPRVEIDFPTYNLEQLNDNMLDFSINFFRQSIAEKAVNVCVSPLSMGYCLGLALNGADGETAAEIREVLGFGDASTADVNAYMKLMIETLPSMDSQTTFLAANSVWARVPLLSDYVQTCTDSYHAEIYSDVPFNGETVKQVNDWCNEKTNGLIPKFVESFSDNTNLLLLNALYFKGYWTEQFKEADTQEEPFYQLSGQSLIVPMMQKSEEIVAFIDEEAGVQFAKIPYGNETFSMILVMPLEEQLPSFLQRLTPEMWDEWMAHQYKSERTIHLPRFTMEYEDKDMVKTLKAMGMEQAFSPSADFSKMTDADVLLNSAMQKVYIKVDEAGTEAAAVTGLVYMDSSIGPVQPLRFDHPFAFFITEESTGAMLFGGTVYRPE